MPAQVYVPSEAAAVVDGKLIPGRTLIRELINQLRAQIQSDPELGERYRNNPGEVLGDRGIVADLQNEILDEQGLPLPEAASRWCISTSSCCCETL